MTVTRTTTTPSRSLDDFFRVRAEVGAPMVLATIVATAGSTYRKPGAQMLFDANGESAGLLSGGCVEVDLIERTREVLATGRAIRVEYDTRGAEDLLWGIGLGCEGAMSILLSRIDIENDYAPFRFVERLRRAGERGRYAVLIDSTSGDMLGRSYWRGALRGAPREVAAALLSSEQPAMAYQIATPLGTALIAPIEPPLRLLVLGAAPDAAPLVEIAGLMNWRVSVLDHRPAYIEADRFPRAVRTGVCSPENLSTEFTTGYDAAVVMSHHFVSDRAYLRALAHTSIPYIGLLGPAARRHKLLAELGVLATKLHNRLYGPVGLDIGADAPETIALAVVAQIEAVRHGRRGDSLGSTISHPVRTLAV